MSLFRRASIHAVAAVLVLTAAGLGFGASGALAQNLALTGVTVLNPADESARSGVLLIQGGVVLGVEDGVPSGFEGEVVDLEGAFVLPALADMHTHSFGNASPAGPPQMLGTQGAANAALYTGVGYILDLFSPETAIFAFREQQTPDDGVGAEVLAAGPCLTAPSGHCSEYGVPTRIVDSPEAARREVNDLAQYRPDVVKIVYDNQSYGGRSMPTVDLPTLQAVIATAFEHGLKTVVHVGTWQDVIDAAEAGAAAVTHTPGPSPMPEGVPAVLLEHGTVHIPTLAVQGDFARMVDDPSLLDDPLLAATVPESLRESYRMEDGPPAQFEGWVGWQRTLIEPNLAAVGVLAAAGVPMLTGTDGGNPAVFQGYSVHRELSLLVEAGLSPWAALRAGTTAAARFLDRRWGSRRVTRPPCWYWTVIRGATLRPRGGSEPSSSGGRSWTGKGWCHGDPHWCHGEPHPAGGGIALGGLRRALFQPAVEVADPSVVRTTEHDFRVVPVVDGLVRPFSMVFTPEGDLLVTERPARLRIIRDGELLPDPVAGLPPVIALGTGARSMNGLEQAGMRDVILHPDFADNRLLYLSYTKPGADSLGNLAVARGRFENDVLTDVEELFHAAAFPNGSDRSSQWGGRMAFGPDGHLFVTVGDRQWPSSGDLQSHPAQDPGNHNGTIVRLREDGSVPDDNPFAGDGGARPEIWSYGHRNAQGLAVRPATGDVWANEHGPQGGDELNLILPGLNYGWPVIGYGVNYRTGAAIHAGTHREGMEQPVHVWVPSIGVSGMLFYSGDAFPNWQGDMLVGGLSGQRLVRLVLDGRTVAREETLLQDPGRVRDVREGPDGLIYLALDGATRDIDGPPTGIVRLEPVERRR